VEVETPVTANAKVTEPEPATLAAEAEGQAVEIEVPITGKPVVTEPEPVRLAAEAEGQATEVEVPTPRPAFAPARPVQLEADVEQVMQLRPITVIHNYDHGIHYHGGNGYEPSPRWDQIG